MVEGLLYSSELGRHCCSFGSLCDKVGGGNFWVCCLGADYCLLLCGSIFMHGICCLNTDYDFVFCDYEAGICWCMKGRGCFNVGDVRFVSKHAVLRSTLCVLGIDVLCFGMRFGSLLMRFCLLRIGLCFIFVCMKEMCMCCYLFVCGLSVNVVE